MSKIRLTVDLPLAEIHMLKKLALQQEITITEALRRAIATVSLLEERRRNGSLILLEKNGNFSKLVFN